jgi:hypothetical protein
MPLRARFPLGFKCPKCGQAGTVIHSADLALSASPHPDFVIHEISPGFRVVKTSVYRPRNKIACDCGEVFAL